MAEFLAKNRQIFYFFFKTIKMYIWSQSQLIWTLIRHFIATSRPILGHFSYQENQDIFTDRTYTHTMVLKLDLRNMVLYPPPPRALIENHSMLYAIIASNRCYQIVYMPLIAGTQPKFLVVLIERRAGLEAGWDHYIHLNLLKLVLSIIIMSESKKTDTLLTLIKYIKYNFYNLLFDKSFQSLKISF